MRNDLTPVREENWVRYVGAGDLMRLEDLGITLRPLVFRGAAHIEVKFLGRRRCWKCNESDPEGASAAMWKEVRAWSEDAFLSDYLKGNVELSCRVAKAMGLDKPEKDDD